ncbi:MAG: terminase gpA endonuclease subunit [Candidatus Helarchaeota archaeon]
MNEIEYVINKIKTLPSEKKQSNIVELAEKRRIFPKGSPFPGLQKYSRTPHMIEIAMELSPSSDTEEIVVMKCSQGGGTAGATEPYILFKILEDPGPILAVTATDELVETWNDERLDPMLEASGAIKKLSSKIQKASQHGGKGNKAKLKTWPGGRLDIKTYGKISQIRQISYQGVILEEEEEAANAVKRGVKQGKFVEVARARSRAYSGRRKILRISTPLIKQTSVISPAFKEGDQRYYNVPCLKCGGLQKLILSNLKYETDENKKVIKSSVYYECKHCKYKIKEHERSEMLVDESKGGKCKWIPENTKNAKPKTKSYHFSALILRPEFGSWFELAQKWVNAQGDPEKLQTFINLELGEPFEDYADRPAAELLHSLKGKYYQDNLPDKNDGKPLFTTLGCDVQAGNKRAGEWIKKPRIEASLYGHGANNRTWLIAHYIIEGETNDYTSGAFAELKEKIMKKDFPIMPVIIFIDSRHQTDEVNKFCNGAKNVFPIMGHNYISKNEGSRYFKEVEIVGFSDAYMRPLKMYELSTNIIKRRLYNKLALRRDNITGQYPTGYLMFPIDMEQKFFDQLTAERPITKNVNGRMRIIFDAGGRANEAMDCFIYAELAKEVFIHNMCIAAGEESVNEKQFWEWAENNFGEI